MVRFHKPLDDLGPREFPPVCADAWGDDEYGLFIDIKIGLATQRFRWIEAGYFQMGRPNSEIGDNDEIPQSWVRISQGYWMADSACTQAFWLAVMSGENPSHFSKDTANPVESVTKKEVIDFTKKLTELLLSPNLEAVLPSEAEWEYACRAGTQEAFSFGATATMEQASYNGNYASGNSTLRYYRQQIVPVKSYPANPWGLYEMHGNVWEWCRDAKRVYEINDKQSATVDPEGQGDGQVLRGGSWNNRPSLMRSASRFQAQHIERNANIGFRVVLKVSK
jgi:formylglycine-generating enzyme